MGKSFRDEKLKIILSRQFHRHILTVSGTSFTDIYRYIQYLALYHTHQFALCERRLLEMKPSHHTVSGLTLIVLHKTYRPYLLIKITLGKGFKKIPSRVFKQVRFD